MVLRPYVGQGDLARRITHFERELPAGGHAMQGRFFVLKLLTAEAIILVAAYALLTVYKEYFDWPLS